jgi:hypothetical protein
MISEEVKDWEISDRIIAFELDHNKFKVKKSAVFLIKVLTAPKL